jgi:leucyl/phenylalanyl-tRNA--protein transferase
MIAVLGPDDPFPPVDRALEEPDGLLAAGGGLSVARLTDAYSRGIFPWFSPGDPVLWWSPDPRMVLAPGELRISRSLARRLRKGGFTVTADRDFTAVIAACAAPRRGERGTWLVPAMQRAYLAMHTAGLAHSIEVWMGEELAGGIYGVALGRMFFGESMFSNRTDGSKIALVHLARLMQRWDMPLLDCQLESEHLASLGARPMPRVEFTRVVAELVKRPPTPTRWSLTSAPA